MSDKRPARPSKEKTKSPARRLVKLGVVLAALLLFITALLPTFVSLGLGRGMIENTIAGQLHGDVSIQAISASWLGGQQIQGLSLTDPEGETTTDLTIDLDRSLLNLIFAGGDYGTIRVSGSASGVRHADGTTSFQNLLASDKSEREHDPNRERRDRERRSNGSDDNTLKFVLMLDGLSVALRDTGLQEDLAINNLKGEIKVDLSRSIEVALTAIPVVGASRGSIRIDGTLISPFDDRGRLNSEAAIELATNITGLPGSILDAAAAMDGRLSALTGPMIEDLTLRASGDLANATLDLSFNSTAMSAAGRLLIEDGILHSDGENPLQVKATLTDELIAAWLDEETAARAGLGTRPWITSNTPAEFVLAVAGLSVPLPADDGLNLAGAMADVTLSGDPFTLHFDGASGISDININTFSARLSATDLTKQIDVFLESKALLDGSEESDLKVALTAANLVQPDGSVTFDPANLTGEVRGANFPTALAQASFVDTPIILDRDIGPTLDLLATFSEGISRTITAEATAANLIARIEADVSADGRIIGRELLVQTKPHPDLIAQYYDRGIRLPEQLTLTATSFSIPAPDADGWRSLGSMAIDGTLALSGKSLAVPPSTASEAEGGGESTPEPTTLSEFDFRFDSTSLAKGVRVAGSMTTNGAAVRVEQTLVGLIASDGTFTVAGAQPLGTIEINNVRPRTLAPFLSDQSRVLRELLQGPLALTVTTSSTEAGDLVAKLTWQSEGLSGNARASYDGEAVKIVSGSGTVSLTSALAAALQRGADSPLDFSANEVAIELSPTTILSRSDSGAFQIGTVSIALRVDRADVSNFAGLTKPLAFHNLNIEILAELGKTPRYSAKGSAIIANGVDGSVVAHSTFDVDLRSSSDSEALPPTIDLSLTQVRTTNVDPLFGSTDPTLSRWLGDDGSFQLRAAPDPSGDITGSITMGFPNLTGEFGLAMDEMSLTLTANEPTFTLGARALESMLNPPRLDGESAGTLAEPVGRIAVSDDVPLKLEVHRLVLPRAILDGGPIPTEGVSVALRLTATKPVILSRTIEGEDTPVEATFNRFAFTITTTDPSRLAYTLNGTLLTSDGESNASRIELSGAMRNLLNEEGAFAPEAAVVDLDVAVTDFPTWVIDVFAGKSSFFSDALGNRMTAEVKSRSFSTESGRLIASTTSTNGSSVTAELAGRGGGVKTQRGKPISGALTFSKALRDRILYKIHPIFQDVRSTDEQIRFTVTDAFVPANNDLTRLSADILIEVGDIELDTGSQLLRIMQLSAASQRETIEGNIGDLQLKIRRGIVTYENFVVSLDKKRQTDEYRHRLVFSGNIDLPRSHVNSVLGAYPLEDLANSVAELAVLPANATIGVEFSGDLYDAEGEPKDLDREIKLSLGGTGDDQDALGGLKGVLDGLLRQRDGDEGGDGDASTLTEEEIRERRRRNREERRRQQEGGDGTGGSGGSGGDGC